jgi:hypothetical protein
MAIRIMAFRRFGGPADATHAETPFGQSIVRATLCIAGEPNIVAFAACTFMAGHGRH